VRPDELPASFSEIPPDSDIGGVRTSIAGTEEAEDAMVEARIPQTTTINRSEASLSVEYDGDPQFEQVTGTSVAYAVNTGAQVLQIDDVFYAVDDGVWFTSTGAQGPWQVADSIPDEKIKEIPPSSPVYNTTYVDVYQSTPQTVTCGYYPGYMWSFPHYGVPVYGTGWYYPPYWGHYYYPRPPTWGFNVGYNPWTGWTFGLSWSNGFMRVGATWGGGYGRYHPGRGYYGGGYHRRPVMVNTGNVNIGNSVNVGNRQRASNRMHTQARQPGQGRNLYNQPQNRARNATPSNRQRDVQKGRPAPSRQNNVYADRNGNVARSSNNGWQTRNNGSWNSSRQPSNRQDLNRSQQQRQSGANRAQRSHSTHRAGGGRGGGGRRR